MNNQNANVNAAQAQVNGNVQQAQAVPQQVATAMPMQQPQSEPFYKKWWFWAGIGVAVVVGGAVVLSKLGADEVASTAADAVTTGV